MKKWIAYTLMIGICLAIGALGGLATDTGSWYQTLNKPAYNPPSWVFGPVWTLLYILMGIAAAQILATRSAGYKTALGWFGIQLLLNLLWSILFFGLHQPAWALVDILLLLAAILVIYRQFQKIKPGTGFWLLPYLAWVAFASILNAHIVLIN